MSARNFSNNNKSRTTGAYVPRVPCCKVCKDAGEPENVYSSHYVKDREGNVTCPKLKAIVCLNCGKRGHTSSYCKAPSAKQREEQAASRAAAAAEASKPLEPPIPKGRFACLFEDDSDDEKLLARKHTKPSAPAARKLPPVAQSSEKAPEAAPINVSNVFEFPALSSVDTKQAASTTTAAAEPKIFSYANMAAKPADPKPIRQVVVVPKRPERPASPDTPPPRFYKKASEMDWAAVDSDSDDDYDYNDDEDF